MEDWQKHIITQNASNLQIHTDCNNCTLISELQKFSLLNDQDKQELAEKVQIKQAQIFYDKLKLQKNAFDTLIKVLKDPRVTCYYAAEILEKGKEEYQRRQANRNRDVPPANLEAAQSSYRSNEIIQMTEEEIIDFMKNRKTLDVRVKRPMTNGTLDRGDYKLPVRKKGMVLVINITDFKDTNRNRKGAQNDMNYMIDLWSELGYHRIRPHEKYITKDKLINYLEEFRKEVKKEKPESIVVFIGSHGKHNLVETSEGQFVHVLSEIVYKFNAEVCKVLEGKPKIFLISTCQEFPTDILQKTSTDGSLTIPMDDAFVLYAATPGYLSKRDQELGSWFTYCFTKVVMENAHSTDFKKLVEMTQNTMKTINGITVDGFGQICSPAQPGSFGTLYFNLDPE